MATTTPNLLIPIDVPGATPGGPTFQWAVDLETFKTIVDSHTHLGTPGTGLQIVSAAININGDLPFNGFNATGFRSLRLSNNASPLSIGTDIGCIYEAAGNLYYNNAIGQQVQLTSGNALNLTGVNGFTGLSGTTGAATYSSGTTTFVFTSAATLSASLDCGSVIVRQPGLANAKGVTIASATSLAANYTLTLPTGLPGTADLLWSNSSGTMSFGAFTSTSGGTFNGSVLFATGTSTFNNGLILPQTALASITTPPASSLAIYVDSLSQKVSGKKSGGGSYPIYMMVANSAVLGAFSTTETIVAGGATGGGNAPVTNCEIPANSLFVGSIVRVTIVGTTTSSVANGTGVKLRIGANGTTADAAVITWPNITASASGSGVVFRMTLLATVTAIGASATFTAASSYQEIMAQGNGAFGAGQLVLGQYQNVASSVATFNSTVANFIEATMVTTASTTSIASITMGMVEIL